MIIDGRHMPAGSVIELTDTGMYGTGIEPIGDAAEIVTDPAPSAQTLPASRDTVSIASRGMTSVDRRVNVDMSSVSIIVFAPSESCPYRARNWRAMWPFWASFGAALIEVRQDGDGPFCKARLAHAGRAASERPTLVFVDADVTIDARALSLAIDSVQSGGYDWATPNSHVVRLTEIETEQYANGGIPAPAAARYVGQDAGGVFVVSSELWDRNGGMDSRFVGWGGEDTAYSCVLRETGRGWHPIGDETLFHFWHPEQHEKCPGMMRSMSKTTVRLQETYLESNITGAAHALEHEEKDMRIEITRNIRVKGRHCAIGTVIDTDDNTAAQLVNWGMARNRDDASRDAEAVASIPDPPKTVTTPRKASARKRRPRKTA